MATTSSEEADRRRNRFSRLQLSETIGKWYASRVAIPNSEGKFQTTHFLRSPETKVLGYTRKAKAVAGQVWVAVEFSEAGAEIFLGYFPTAQDAMFAVEEEVIDKLPSESRSKENARRWLEYGYRRKKKNSGRKKAKSGDD